MAGAFREWVRANDAQRVGNMGSSYFLSPRPTWRPLSNKQQTIDNTLKRLVGLSDSIGHNSGHPTWYVYKLSIFGLQFHITIWKIFLIHPLKWITRIEKRQKLYSLCKDLSLPITFFLPSQPFAVCLSKYAFNKEIYHSNCLRVNIYV